MPGRHITGSADFVPPKTSHHSKKIVRRGRFSSLADTPQLVSARETWMAALRPFAPKEPLNPPLFLVIELTWPWRKGDSPKARERGREYCTVKPDLDNCLKTITDVMALLGFFTGDQGIVSIKAVKFLGDRPGIVFNLWEE